MVLKVGTSSAFANDTNEHTWQMNPINAFSIIEFAGYDEGQVFTIFVSGDL
jgi:hypothetical protein